MSFYSKFNIIPLRIFKCMGTQGAVNQQIEVLPPAPINHCIPICFVNWNVFKKMFSKQSYC